MLSVCSDPAASPQVAAIPAAEPDRRHAGDLPGPGSAGNGATAEGMAIAWGQLDVAQVVAAANRHQQHKAGMDLPGWGEWRDPFEWPDASGEAGADSAQACDERFIDGRGIDERVMPAGSLGGHVLVMPGPQLAGWLAGAGCSQLDDAALVTSITGWRKLTSWAQAHELAAVAELARRRGVGAGEAEDPGDGDAAEIPGLAADSQPGAEGGHGRDTKQANDVRRELEAEFAPQEVALALTLTRYGAEYWTDLAVSLSGRLPRTLAALSRGEIDLSRARLIEQYTAQLTPDLARRVEEKVLGNAERQTTGQLRAVIRRAVIAVDPAAAERRRQEAEQNARVEVYGDSESTAAIGGRFLPAAHTAAAWARICALAKAMESAGASGGADVLRAQVFMGLLLGTLPLIPPAQERPDDSQPAGTEPESPAGGADHPDSGSYGDDGPPDRDPPDSGPRGGGPQKGGPRDDGPPDRDPAGRVPSDGDPPKSAVRDSSPHPGRTPDGRPRDTDPRASCPRASCPRDRVPSDGGPPERPPDPPATWPPIPPPGHTPAPGCAGAGPGPSSRDGPGADSAAGDRAPPRPASSAGATGPAGWAEPATAGAAPVPRGGVALLIPWRTLAGVTAEAGQVSRIGPVTAEVARALAAVAVNEADCEWRMIITGPAGNALAVTTIRKSWLAPNRRQARAAGEQPRRGGQVVARVVLTLPLAALDKAKAPRQGPAGRAGPPELEPVLAAALRAASRTAERGRAATQFAAGDTSSGGACQHEDGVPGYRVPDSMRALLEARDRTCRHPGCRCPAWRSDQDHTIPYEQGGPTCPCNLSSECRHHHRLKQLSDWLLSQPHPGVLTWHTPAGLAYTVSPEPYGA